MIRVHVICEGQTEEMFVNEVLSDTLRTRGLYLVPSLVGKPGHKGGALRLGRLFTDVRARLLGETKAYCTTFFDFYGLPSDFPGKREAHALPGAREKARCILDALTEYFRAELGDDPLRRFIPYVQMHEFEGLLFSDTSAFARGINQTALTGPLQTIRSAFGSPEDINDNPVTAPSKRIVKLFPGYEKPLHGSLAALEMQLDAIRRECPLFNEWIERIEGLASGDAT
jgi:hypothetical protein